MHFAIALGAGLATGLLGALLGAAAGAREGVPGLLAGIGLFGGGLLTWRAFGFTTQDLRDFFRRA